MGKINLLEAKRKIISFVKTKVREAKADGLVVGISGGIDSAVVAYLAVEALGSKRVLGLIMPDLRVTPQGDVEDAKQAVEDLGIQSRMIDIAPVHNSFMKQLQHSSLAEGNLRARIRMALLYFHANIMNALVAGTGDRSEILMGYFCYDRRTRVLTPDGPKYYWELTPGSNVFSINLESGKMEDSIVHSIHVFDYNGWMFKIDAQHADLVVTPNHRMLVSRNHGRGPLAFRRARSVLSSSSFSIPLPLPCEGTVPPPNEIDLNDFVRSPISTNANQPFRMGIADFLYLMGLFIADGTVGMDRVRATVKSELSREDYTSSHRDGLGGFTKLENPVRIDKTYKEPRIYIASSAGKRSCRPLTDLLNCYGIDYSSTATLVAFYKAFSSALAECGHGALNKKIPSWVLRFPASTLFNLYRGLMDSDGGANGGGYTTTSLTLAHQVVELCARLGMYSRIKWRPPKKTTYQGKAIASSGTYEVRINGNIRTLTVRRANVEKVLYSGKIWCPGVPPNENILVERNGKFVFCGNTKFGDGGVDILPIGDLYKTEVRQLGELLGVSRRVILKRSSPHLWPNQTAESEIGLPYDVIDQALELYFEKRMPTQKISLQLKVPIENVSSLIKRNRLTAHKRRMPLVCRLR